MSKGQRPPMDAVTTHILTHTFYRIPWHPWLASCLYFGSLGNLFNREVYKVDHKTGQPFWPLLLDIALLQGSLVVSFTSFNS